MALPRELLQDISGVLAKEGFPAAQVLAIVNAAASSEHNDEILVARLKANLLVHLVKQLDAYQQDHAGQYPSTEAMQHFADVARVILLNSPGLPGVSTTMGNNSSTPLAKYSFPSSTSSSKFVALSASAASFEPPSGTPFVFGGGDDAATGSSSSSVVATAKSSSSSSRRKAKGEKAPVVSKETSFYRAAVAQLAAQPDAIKLTLVQFLGSEFADLLVRLSACTRLKDVTIIDPDHIHDNERTFRVLSSLPATVEVLRVEHACLHESVAVHGLAVALNRLPVLRELRLADNTLGEGGGFKLHLAGPLHYHKSLRVLDLSRNNLEDSCGLAFQSLLRENRVLEELYLGGNALGSGFVDPITEALCEEVDNSTLRVLDLSDNDLDSDCAEMLADSLSVLTELRRLDLSSNCIGPRGIEALADALEDTYSTLKLTDMDLSDNHGTSAKYLELAVGNVCLIHNLLVVRSAKEVPRLSRQSALRHLPQELARLVFGMLHVDLGALPDEEKEAYYALEETDDEFDEDDDEDDDDEDDDEFDDDDDDDDEWYDEDLDPEFDEEDVYDDGDGKLFVDIGGRPMRVDHLYDDLGYDLPYHLRYWRADEDDDSYDDDVFRHHFPHYDDDEDDDDDEDEYDEDDDDEYEGMPDLA